MPGMLTWETGSRQQSRLSLHLPGIVTTAYGTRRVLLLDLSLKGARIRSDAGYQPGQQAVLQWNRFEVLGSVQWVEGALCGLRFTRAIQVRDLIETRDLDQASQLEVERDVVRRTAAAFVNGRMRL